jgi:hypothetical protein
MSSYSRSVGEAGWRAVSNQYQTMRTYLATYEDSKRAGPRQNIFKNNPITILSRFPARNGYRPFGEHFEQVCAERLTRRPGLWITGFVAFSCRHPSCRTVNAFLTLTAVTRCCKAASGWKRLAPPAWGLPRRGALRGRSKPPSMERAGSIGLKCPFESQLRQRGRRGPWRNSNARRSPCAARYEFRWYVGRPNRNGRRKAYF